MEGVLLMRRSQHMNFVSIGEHFKASRCIKNNVHRNPNIMVQANLNHGCVLCVHMPQHKNKLERFKRKKNNIKLAVTTLKNFTVVLVTT
jgi:hypothetical protein